MSIPKVPSYGTVTVKALADLPARILGGTGIQVNVAGFDYRIDVDIEELQTSPLGAANGKYTMVWDSLDGTYKKIEFTQLPAPYTDWSVITSKPATFPPTLPIAESGVTNLVADLAARPTDGPQDGKTYGRRNGAWQDVAAGVTIVVNWTDIVGKPSTFPPSAHTHPESEVVGLVADLAARELIANKGAASGYAPLDSGSKVPTANLPAYLADAPSDGKTYGRNTATWSNITDAYTAKTGLNGASNLPSGTTAQRPATTPGLIRFNTDTSTFEGYNGTSWAGIGGGVYVSLTAPPTPRNGDLWWKSDVGLMLIYYDDGGSQQWVVANPSQDIAALDTRYTKKAGDTMTGDLVLAKAAPVLNLNDTASAAQSGTLQLSRSGSLRWSMYDYGAESSGNAGSDLNIARYADNGVAIDNALTIKRSTGAIIASQGFVTGHNIVIGAVNNIAGWCVGVDGTAIGESSNVPLHINKIGANGVAQLIYQASTSCGSISVANSTSTSFNTSSDGRLKIDRQDFDAGPILDALKVYDFKWTTSEARGHGVIAQEAVEVFPEAIFHDEDMDTWGADYSKFVPLLLQEIKALRARVAVLEAR